MKTISARDESEPLITWRLRDGTYVPVRSVARRDLGRLDQDRANSMTDEGGPSPPEGVTDDGPQRRR